MVLALALDFLEATSVPKRPGLPPGCQEKACRSAAKKKPADRPPRKSLQIGRPAAKKKPAGPAGKACRPGPQFKRRR
jgi:hypothetical protein